MASRTQSAFAAPPDAAGHQGSYTTPQEVMEMHAADQPPRAPALNRDLDRLEGAGDGASPVAMIAWVLLLLGIAAFFVLIRS